MTRARSQAARVLAVLRRVGSAGVTQVDFHPNDEGEVIDGGPPILRLASRIHDLRLSGHRITKSTEPNGTARYALVRDAEVVTSARRRATAQRPREDVESGGGDLTLWDVPPQTAARSVFDPWDGDA